MNIYLFNLQILVSKPVADTLLKYRSIWDNEEPILTEEIIINSPSDLSVSENKKILLLPDSSNLFIKLKYM